MEQYQISLSGKPNIVYTISYNEMDHVLFIFYILQGVIYTEMGKMDVIRISTEMPTLANIEVYKAFREKGYALIMIRILAEYLNMLEKSQCFDLTDASDNVESSRNIYRKVGCGDLAKNIRNNRGMNMEEQFNRICNIHDVLRETSRLLNIPPGINIGYQNRLTGILQNVAGI